MAAPKRATPAQIINHLRKAEVELANGKSSFSGVFDLLKYLVTRRRPPTN